MMLTLHPNVPAKTVKELVNVAKANPGKLSYGSSGTASIVHMAGELFNVSAGVKTVHIPYKGTGPALIDLLGGQIDMMFASPVPTLPHVKSGRLRAIAMASLQRTAAMPDLPTVAESGLPGFEAATFFVVLGPANLPSAVVNRLHGEMSKAAQLADVKDRLAAEGAIVVGGTPQDAMAHIESEIARWTNVVKVSGIRAE
jgi:tripartite-type tricarboxylate transporter receptor subunit TctC